MLEKFCWIVGIYIVVAIIEIIIVNWAMNKFFWIKYEKDSPISNSVHFRGSWKASVLTKQKGKKMESNKRKIIICQNQVLTAIEQLSPKKGDVLIFSIKTDDCGIPLCSYESVKQTADIVQSALNGKGVQSIFIIDTIPLLFRMSNIDSAIEKLETAIEKLKTLKKTDNDNEESIFNTVKIFDEQ